MKNKAIGLSVGISTQLLRYVDGQKKVLDEGGIVSKDGMGLKVTGACSAQLVCFV